MHTSLARSVATLLRYTVVMVSMSIFVATANAQTDGASDAIEFLQQVQAESAGSLQQADSQLDSARDSGDNPDVKPENRVAGGAIFPTQSSAIETDYSQRAEENLTLFGYDLFSGGAGSGPLVGAVQESYILGVDDELVISFRGQLSETFTVPVDREGRVILPNLPPIYAAGRPFRAFRADLERLTKDTFLGTQVYASVGTIRTVRVMVVGEVSSPGFKRVTSLSTLLDALVLSGGIRKTGSLRRVQLIRGGQSQNIDLYDLLLRGQVAHDLTLVEGDRIFVPPLGQTVAVAGWVKRPGIFELAEAEKSVSLQDMVALAGGWVRSYGLRHLLLTPDPSGVQQVVELATLEGHAAHDGGLLLVNLSEDIQVGDVFVDGHVRIKERRSLALAPTVQDLLRSGSTIRPDPYLLFAVVQTADSNTRARRYYPVSLERVLLGHENYSLRNGDRLIVFSSDDIRFLASADVQSALGGLSSSDGATGTTCAGLKALRALKNAASARFFSEAQIFPVAADRSLTSATCPAVFNQYPDLLIFVLDHVVSLLGEVQSPGVFPIVPGTSIELVLSNAGGLTRQADLTEVELTRTAIDQAAGQTSLNRQTLSLGKTGLAATTGLLPGDVVRFNRLFTDLDGGFVNLAGEFRRPGNYRIRRGEMLSELIERAGGLAPQAYPYGAVFTREAAKARERAALERLVRDLESAIATAVMSNTSGGDSGANLASAGQLVEIIRSTPPVGRVVVEADPTVLQVRPDLDMLMQSGDVLFMPKRPSSVSVAGEVLNPGSQQFRTGSSPEDYLRLAGGTQPGADETRIFILLPNGEAQPLDLAFWNYEPVLVPPGSAIVVPRDPAPFDFLTLAKDLTQVLGQVSLIAASLAVFGNN